jgi:hypothetical protein
VKQNIHWAKYWWEKALGMGVKQASKELMTLNEVKRLRP